MSSTISASQPGAACAPSSAAHRPAHALWQMPLACHLRAVPLARTEVRYTLTTWGYPPAVQDDACLIATELLSNAVRHGGSNPAAGTVLVRLTSTHTMLDIAVADGNPRLPWSTPPRGDGEGGRGLLLVRSLSWRWGATQAGCGKLVWALLKAPLPQAVRH